MYIVCVHSCKGSLGNVVRLDCRIAVFNRSYDRLTMNLILILNSKQIRGPLPLERSVTARFVIKTRFVIIHYKTGGENIITIRVDSYNPFCNKNPNCNKTLSLQ